MVDRAGEDEESQTRKKLLWLLWLGNLEGIQRFRSLLHLYDFLGGLG